MLKKETIDWIGEHLKNVKHLQPSVISRIPVEIIDDLNGELSRVPEYENIRNIIHSVIDGTCLERCRTCGKLMTYTKSVISRCEYCSRECIDNELRRGRMKEVFMKKYGVENISQSPVIKEKKRQSSLSHYGTENVFQSKQVQEKQKRTCLERYGVENVFQSEDVKIKTRHTCMERYGVENVLQNEKIKQKRKNTCVERYGVDNIFRNEQFQRRMLDRNYDAMKEKWGDHVIPLFSRQEYAGHYMEHKSYRWKCVKCGNEFESEIYNTNHLRDIG